MPNIDRKLIDKTLPVDDARDPIPEATRDRVLAEYFAGLDACLMVTAGHRYSLGRASYIVGSCIDHLTRHWCFLDPNTRGIIVRDTVEALSRGDVGMGQDRAAWRDFLAFALPAIDIRQRDWLRQAVAYAPETISAYEADLIRHVVAELESLRAGDPRDRAGAEAARAWIARLDALEAEVARLGADRARLDWIEADEATIDGSHPLRWCVRRVGGEFATAITLRRAIDEAMAPRGAKPDA